jgi:hypothetical protein
LAYAEKRRAGGHEGESRVRITAIFRQIEAIPEPDSRPGCILSQGSADSSASLSTSGPKEQRIDQYRDGWRTRPMSERP